MLLVALAATGALADDTRLIKVRQTLGGEKLDKISTLQLEGTYRRQLGEREMSGDLELAFGFPDRFLRTETMSFDPPNVIRRYSGFNGTTPIERISGGGGAMFQMRGPGGQEISAEQREQRLMRVIHREFGRLLIALLAGSTSSYPLEYRYAGEAESDDGKADVFAVTGPDEFAAQLLVEKETHVPLMLMFKDAMPRMQMFRGGGPGGPRPSREQIDQRMREARSGGPPPQTDMQLFLSDYKTVDGVLVPHVIRRAVDGKTVEEWEIKTVKINPSFKEDKFDTK
jgi:hypothetical protein